MRTLLVWTTQTVAIAAVRVAPSPTPYWLQIPACRPEAALALAAPTIARRVQETHVDQDGTDTTGKCLPFALLQQLQLGGLDDDIGGGARDITAIDALRDTVLDYAIANEAKAWDEEQGYPLLGNVIAAVAAFRGWPSQPRALAVRAWATRIRARPREGCDAAFLFAAAARFGVTIRVHYLAGFVWQAADFAPPRSSAFPSSGNSILHVGFCDNGVSECKHYVSMPRLWS